jgi:AcrR family transcriptional regulator
MPKRTFFRLDEDKRERVIRSAIDEFRINGFENSKVGSIAQNANIANGSIYQYFEDKRELFMYCVNWTVENFIRELDRQLPLAGIDLFEYLQSGLADRIEYWRQEPELAMFSHELINGAIGFPPGETNAVREFNGVHIPKLIANGQKWGALRDDADGEMLEMLVAGIVREAEEYIYKKAVAANFVLSKEQMADNAAKLSCLIDLLRNGIMKRDQ